ncbi:MAG: cytochrome c [Chloroflexi bacterium]|nr:cytochrome c [Chloroflexota bacterium]
MNLPNLRKILQSGFVRLLTLTISLTTLFTLTVNTLTLAQESVLPLALPDAETGLVIYAERCVVCHGALGAGDGQEALSAGLEPRNFTDPAYQLTAEPQLMFDVISNGSLANGMPPFGPSSSDPLDEADRWDLIAAVTSFGITLEELEQGETLYADLGGDPADIPSLEYWFTRSNETVLADLDDGDWGVDTGDLTEAEKLVIVDYGRTQNYIYANPLAAFEPIETAIVSGLVVNGSTAVEVNDAQVILRAFNTNFEPALTMTTTVDSGGRYTFELTDVLPDWVYLATAEYNDLSFNSNAVQLSRENPELDLPIIVYDTSSDPDVVSIEQIHMILSFVPGGLQVSELYVFNNDANAVFVGETGNAIEGTVAIQIPAGAAEVDFRRAFGSLDNFVPAPEVIQTETGWADTLPLRPGTGSANLLVSYQLSYEDGLLLAHPLTYPLNNVTAILTDDNVTVGGDGWQSQGAQTTGGSTFISYMNSSLTGAEALSMELDGRPHQLSDSQGNTIATRNDTQELIIGLSAFGLALIAGLFLVRKWQMGEDTADDDAEAQALLETIAELDDAYEAGDIGQSDYAQQREQLKADLIAIWPQAIV